MAFFLPAPGPGALSQETEQFLWAGVEEGSYVWTEDMLTFQRCSSTSAFGPWCSAKVCSPLQERARLWEAAVGVLNA